MKIETGAVETVHAPSYETGYWEGVEAGLRAAATTIEDVYDTWDDRCGALGALDWASDDITESLEDEGR